MKIMMGQNERKQKDKRTKDITTTEQKDKRTKGQEVKTTKRPDDKTSKRQNDQTTKQQHDIVLSIQMRIDPFFINLHSLFRSSPGTFQWPVWPPNVFSHFPAFSWISRHLESWGPLDGLGDHSRDAGVLSTGSGSHWEGWLYQSQHNKTRLTWHKIELSLPFTFAIALSFLFRCYLLSSHLSYFPHSHSVTLLLLRPFARHSLSHTGSFHSPATVRLLLFSCHFYFTVKLFSHSLPFSITKQYFLIYFQ